MSEQGWLKCAFCDYRTLRYRGRKVSGVRKLRVHVRECHHEEYVAICLRSHQATALLEDEEGLDALEDYDRRATEP